MESLAPINAATEPPRPTDTAPIRAYTTANCVSAIGNWMQKTAMGWLAWDLTHSAAWVGALALMDLIALLWVAPLAGTVTDRRSPYRMFITTQCLLLVNAMGLCLLDASGFLNIGLLLAFALIESTLSGFNNPVRMTAISLLAVEGGTSKAIAMNSVSVATARSVGPAVAGALLASGGAAVVFAVNSLSYLAMIFVLRRLRTFIDHPPHGEPRPLLAAITGGFAYAVRMPDIATALVLALVFGVLARPALELLPAFAGGVFHGGPRTLGLLLTFQSIGALAGAIFMMRRNGSKPLRPLMFATGLSLPVFIIAFCATRDLWIALPAMAATGVAHVVCNICMQSTIIQQADPAYRGRVLSIFSLLFRTGPAAGAFLIGVAAPYLGLRTLIAGAAAVAVVLMWGLSRRRAASQA